MLGIVMAGGKSSRMGMEKQMIEFKGKLLLDIACESIILSGNICFVAISKNAPNTMKYAMSKYHCFLTPGNGYVEDVKFILNILNTPFITVASDIPFVKPWHIKEIVENFHNKSVAGVILDENGVHYTGINIVSNIGDDYYLFKDKKLLFNINTREDLEMALKVI
ncbi:MAG: NTP transferase domain-containing protein [Thermoplasmata archaeon]